MQSEPEILFDDEHFLAVSKQAGMIVNNADTSRHMETLQDWVAKTLSLETLTSDKTEYLVDGYNKYDEFISRGGIVHRLDKETSGVILIAKNVSTFMQLQSQFKSSTVKKEYIALVHGRLEESGIVNAPIGRLPWNRMRFGVLDAGRSAETYYEAAKYYKEKISGKEEDLTLVNVYPKTGRTHQIRVHFQYIKHPIFADALYAGRKTSRDDRKRLPRHFLHAAKISLRHPVSQKPLEITAPLPDDLSSFLDSLTEAS